MTMPDKRTIPMRFRAFCHRCRLARAALRGPAHYFTITIADGTEHYWGIKVDD